MNDWRYCPGCGTSIGGHEEAVEAETEAETVEEITAAEVRIAEINADRDIKLARINAGVFDQEREVELAAAEGALTALEQVVAPEPADDGDSQVVVVNEAHTEEEEPEAAPPPAEHHEEHHEPKKKSGFFF